MPIGHYHTAIKRPILKVLNKCTLQIHKYLNGCKFNILMVVNFSDLFQNVTCLPSNHMSTVEGGHRPSSSL